VTPRNPARRGICSALVLLVTAVPAVRAGASVIQPSESLLPLLGRAGAYADQLEDGYSRIVGAEDYLQTVQIGAGRTQGRHLQSEVFFVRIDESRAWMMVRNVLKVDERAVPGARDRIMAALADRSPGRTARLRALADEGARYNIGGLQRNFSDPILALTFLDHARQPRFSFKADGPTAIDGTPLHRLIFEERTRPTLIRNGRTGESIPSNGTLDLSEDGQVRRSELNVEVDQQTTAGIRVRFDPDAKLGMLVPALMEEDYRVAGRTATVITCKAVYSDFRRFETAVRIVP
jgi:hypothetical protein